MLELEDLVRKAQKGNGDAFITLIELNKKTMYRAARSLLDNDEDIADIIQETVFKAYKAVKNLKEPRYFKTWLVRILLNNCYSFMRKNEKVISLDEVIEAGGRCGELEEIEVKQVVNGLEPQLKAVAELYYLEDYSVKEISSLENIPEGTVKSRLFRARKFLSEIFETGRNKNG